MTDFFSYLYGRYFSENRHFYKIIYQLFGIRAANIELYKLAFIHKSASIKLGDGQVINNERLEFLGDAVIETVVSDMVYIEFPEEDEGVLTQLRSKIVSRASLNNISEQIGLSHHIIAQPNMSATNKNMAGDAFEAIVGAIYLDKGYDFANRLLINNIFSRFIDLDTINEIEVDFKSRLIEWCQKNKVKANISTTQSTMFSEDGHPAFQCEITIGRVSCYGIGDSKKAAEQRASKNSLEKLTTRRKKIEKKTNVSSSSIEKNS
ncbi:MAG: ribonuclease III [Rikenellaceae bacterium]